MLTAAAKKPDPSGNSASVKEARSHLQMRIAQIAPLFESVPPKTYGGTERVVSYLTEALVQLGHDVTLYASGDSRTAARLRAMCPRSLRLDPCSIDPVADHLCMAETVLRESA